MIDKLEFLIALARERNFSRAAESCGVTQPTLSAGIKQLEDTLGVLLVYRSSRFYGLTAEGERVLEWARRIVSDARAMRQDVHASKTALAGHLTLAAVPTALPMVAELTTPFQANHPDVHFTVLSRTSREILSMLDDFQIDAGLTYLDNEPLGQLHTVPLYREQHRLLTSAGSPVADCAEVTWADVGRIPLCLLTPDMQNRRIIDRLLANSAAPPPPVEIQLDGGFIFTCLEWRLRLHCSGKARQSAGRERALAFDTDHGTTGTSYHRARVAAPGARSAVNPGACRRSKQARHAAKTVTFERFH